MSRDLRDTGVLRLTPKPRSYEDIVRALRSIADELERGEFSDWPVTTAALVFGHSEERPEGEDTLRRVFCRSYGLGPRSDPYTVKGLLAEVLHRGFGDD